MSKEGHFVCGNKQTRGHPRKGLAPETGLSVFLQFISPKGLTCYFPRIGMLKKASKQVGKKLLEETAHSTMLYRFSQTRQRGPPKEALGMSLRDRRRHIRLQHHFPAKVFKLGLDSPVHGVTANVSPGGAFIETADYRVFQVEDQTTVTLLLPPSFSGQDQVIALQSAATITRVNRQDQGIGLKFDKTLKEFVLIDKK